MYITKLEIFWDTNHERVTRWKLERDTQLPAESDHRMCKFSLITIEVGSRGFTSSNTAADLKQLSFEERLWKADNEFKSNRSLCKLLYIY